MLTYKRFLLEDRKSEALSSPGAAFYYALDQLHGPFPEGEKIIAQDANDAYRYAYEVLGRRFRLGEPRILGSNPHIAFDYVVHVIKNRWPVAENLIKMNASRWARYLYFLAETVNRDSRQKWENMAWNWLRDPRCNMENTIEILNTADYESSWGSTDAMHEFICQQRPDLINKIFDLSPELAKKYSHERELGTVDL
jgi:hypothetical protein